MLRRWLRRRARSELGSAVLQSSAIGLIHFPVATMQPPKASGACGADVHDVRLEPSAAHTGHQPATEDLLGDFKAANFSRPRRIVVGVTHDQGARNALRWAYQTAIADDATLIVVTAFESPCPVLTISGWAFIDARDAAAAAEFMQDNVLRDELRSENPRPRVRTVITRGDPARVLVAAARRADLLVVGRSTSRLWRFPSRSVSRRCANRADCPVVIVRSGVVARHRSGPALRRVPTPADECRGGNSVDTADGRMHHARGHPQFEFRRRGF
jgi:nucleotide-binding universal stress UspA family protein